MKIEEYKTLAEKDDFFQSGSSKINTIEEFKAIINEFSKPTYKSYYFRGVSNAKYKMYNTAQRNYIWNKDYEIEPDYGRFIFSLIQTVQEWNNGKIKDALIELGINHSNYLSYLSLMQHAGEPSPCIDFSSDPNVAAFFMLNSLEYSSENEIDEYCSLYLFDSNIPLLKFNVANIVKDGSIERGITDEERIEREYFGILFNIKRDLIIDLTLSPEFRAYNSMRIIAQKGRLIFNPSPNKSLEKVIKDIHSSHPYNLFKCLNFHHSIKSEGLKYLNKLGYSKDSLYL